MQARTAGLHRRGAARKPYRDEVERLIRKGEYTANEIALMVSCDRAYVDSVACKIGRHPRRETEAVLTIRGDIDVKADAAELLTVQWRKQQALWGFED